MRFLNFILSWLAAPALLAEKEREIARLEAQISELQEERKRLQDSFLLKNGAYPLNPEPLQPAQQRDTSSAYDVWKQADIERELVELNGLAQSDPDAFGALYEEAILRYNEEQKR